MPPDSRARATPALVLIDAVHLLGWPPRSWSPGWAALAPGAALAMVVKVLIDAGQWPEIMKRF